jgi:hypothetical protein
VPEAAQATPSEADQLAAAAEAANEAMSGEAEAIPLGVRVQTAITCQSLLPYQTYSAEQCLGKARGWHQSLGRVRGVVVTTERKRTMRDGEVLESIALNGIFDCYASVRGELIQGKQLYLPKVYAERIAKALEAGAERVDVDIDIGMESTGRSPVSYAWTITHYLTGQASRALRELALPRAAVASPIRLAGSEVAGPAT